MDRRSFCKTAGALESSPALPAVSVCSVTPAPRVLSSAPDQDLSEASFPSYGDEMPEFTVPDPIRNEEISTAQFEGERAVLWTSFTRTVRTGSVPPSFSGSVAGRKPPPRRGTAIKSRFSPPRSIPSATPPKRSASMPGQQGVDLDAGNWHFLRPETYERAQEIHDEHFGLKIEKTPADDIENLEYRFPHYGLIILANKRGIIERAYPRGPKTDIERLVDDLKRVATA